MNNLMCYVSPSVRSVFVEFRYGLAEQPGSASAGRQGLDTTALTNAVRRLLNGGVRGRPW